MKLGQSVALTFLPARRRSDRLEHFYAEVIIEQQVTHANV